MGVRAALGVMALLLGGSVVAGCGGSGGDQPARDQSGSVTKATDAADVFSLRVGDCMPAADLQGQVSDTPVVPCSEPHEGEVYAALTATGGKEYPGVAEVEKQAAACEGRFDTFVGKPYAESKLELNYLYPVKESWENLADREILCIVRDPAGNVTGTLKGAKR